MADLPFNLSLTETEKEARSQVKLPYVKDGCVVYIYYKPEHNSNQVLSHKQNFCKCWHCYG